MKHGIECLAFTGQVSGLPAFFIGTEPAIGIRQNIGPLTGPMVADKMGAPS